MQTAVRLIYVDYIIQFVQHTAVLLAVTRSLTMNISASEPATMHVRILSLYYTKKHLRQCQ
jgi:hypothetical protein